MRLEDTVERLKFVQRDMSNLKRSPTAPLAQCVLNNVVGGCCTPRPLQQKFGYDAVARATLIFSNVPGPQEPFCFGGQQITGLQMIFPNLPPQGVLVCWCVGKFMGLRIGVLVCWWVGVLVCWLGRLHEVCTPDGLH